MGKTSKKPEKSTQRFAGRVKIQDVARLADVSLSTVSGVLNDKSNVRSETRQRILDVIAQVGYSPNIFASNLARRKTKIIGIAVSDLLNPFFAETASAVDAEARRLGYDTFLVSTGFSEEKQRSAVRQMLSYRVAGVAMMTSENDPEAFALLKNSGTPCVYLDNDRTAPKIGTVRIDKRRGMFIAVEHLLELGHRKILAVKNSVTAAVDPPILSYAERQLGFDDAIHRYNSQEMEVHVLDEPGMTLAAGSSAIEKALRLYDITAVVAFNDLLALGVFRGLQAAGIRVPNDISVVGFDNTYLCDYLYPPLTTVATPRVELATAVLEMLLAFDRDDEVPQRCLLQAHLVVRGSTGPPARWRIPGKPRRKSSTYA